MRNRQFCIVCLRDANSEGRGEVLESQKTGSLARCDKLEQEGLLLLAELVHYAPKMLDEIFFTVVSVHEGLRVLAPITDIDFPAT